MRKVEIELEDDDRYIIVGSDELKVFRFALNMYFQEMEHREKELLQTIYTLKQDEDFVKGLQVLVSGSSC